LRRKKDEGRGKGIDTKVIKKKKKRHRGRKNQRLSKKNKAVNGAFHIEEKLEKRGKPSDTSHHAKIRT